MGSSGMSRHPTLVPLVPVSGPMVIGAEAVSQGPSTCQIMNPCWPLDGYPKPADGATAHNQRGGREREREREKINAHPWYTDTSTRIQSHLETSSMISISGAPLPKEGRP